MAYRLKRSDDDLTAAIRRIARDQLDKAVERIEGEDGTDLAETIHDVRKRAKKVRGLIRLVRPALPAYSKENRALRDAARRLSPLRDRGAMIEAYDTLFARYGAGIDQRPFGPLRRAFTLEHTRIENAPETFEALHAFRKDIEKVRKRVGKWKLTETDDDAVALGVAKTYDRAAKATRKAGKKAAPDRIHEWRKRAKYHRYHARIMAPVWPEMLGPRRDAAHRLEDLLGEHRDLTLLSEEARTFERPADIAARADLTGFAERRQAEILAEAVPLARRLFDEPSGALTDRWTGWYGIWRKEG